MGHTCLRTLLVIAVVMIATCQMLAGDSTSLVSGLPATKRAERSIVGDVKNGMTCKYVSSDSKIHCKYSDGPEQEYLVDSVLSPAYSRFQRNKPGKITKTAGSIYAFIDPVHTSSSGSVVEKCRLALQFRTTQGEIIWIWHDELRYGDQGEYAAIDTNGDDHADIAVTGTWNGRLFGIRKWQPGSSVASYSQAELEYPSRPEITEVTSNNRSRGCKPVSARVAVLKVLTTGKSVGNTVKVWRTENSP